ncbi:MAG: hypothetical protein JNM62_16175 [Flavobacteriales bacterium]|nr:hypothetical protein [Flavobacteriales bacterium]
MYTGLKHFHSFVAYIALLALTIAVVHAVISLVNKRPFTPTSKKIVLFGLVSAHVQMLFGLFLYFTSPMGFTNLNGEAMGNSLSRLFALEHPLIMLLGIVVITIGYSKAKRTTDDQRKFKLISRMYAVGLVLILSRIPWAVWFA